MGPTILLAFLVCLQTNLSEARGRCPFGFMHKPKLPSNQTCSSVNVTSCNSTSKYRTYDGSCNNLQNPLWGVPNSRYQRLVPARYGDGIYSPRLTATGNNLPSAREVSTVVYSNTSALDGRWTLLNMQFGQFLAHDMSEAKNTTRSTVNDCCSSGTEDSKRCYPILVPSNDADYAPINISCLNFTRTLTDKDSNCSGKWNVAEQLNNVNAYIDLSQVYGNDEATNTELRSFSGGLLISEERNSQAWLPSNPNASSVCRSTSSSDKCYLAGDDRVNQNPELAILQTLFLREHNRIATELAELNPSWNDETLFQEARKINIGQYQAITYNEWLPIILGSDIVTDRNITYTNVTDFINDYNQSINAEILNEHATAAYRFFHTTIEGFLDSNNEARDVLSTSRISDWWLNPSLIEETENSTDELLRGCAWQPENRPDRFHTSEILFFWLREQNATWGQDLKAIDTQRNRDHGLPSYNEMRVLFGLANATSFDDFTDAMTSENAALLASAYEEPTDVDLDVGGSLETITFGQGLAGFTFKAILAEQFWRSRVGDRFFFENSGVTGFSVDQLNELRKATISRIICDNSLNIVNMQPNGFELNLTTNALTSCDNLPSVNLTLWQDTSTTTS